MQLTMVSLLFFLLFVKHILKKTGASSLQDTKVNIAKLLPSVSGDKMAVDPPPTLADPSAGKVSVVSNGTQPIASPPTSTPTPAPPPPVASPFPLAVYQLSNPLSLLGQQPSSLQLPSAPVVQPRPPQDITSINQLIKQISQQVPAEVKKTNKTQKGGKHIFSKCTYLFSFW